MTFLENWKDITFNFTDPVIWQKRKDGQSLSTDPDFENFLIQLKAKGMGDKEKSFLNKILDANGKIDKEDIKQKLGKHPSPLDLSLMSIPERLLLSYDLSFDTYLSFQDWDSHHLRAQVLSCLTGLLKTFLEPTITYEYYVFLKAYERKDEIDSLTCFVSEIANSDEWIVYFFESYPVLLSLLMTFSEYFAIDIDRLLSRLSKDLNEIRLQFEIPGTARLHELKLFLGDPHKGWQSTSLLRFCDENKEAHDVYYKPRSLAGDIFFNDFIACLSSLGLEKSLELAKVIDKQSYGWQKGITYTPFTEEKNIPDFFYFQGINSAIAYALNLQDLLADNVIVSNGYPVFFDLEMMLIPQWKKGKDYKTRSKAGREFLEGVIKTGLVPSFGFETINNKGYSNSGVCKVSDNEYKMFVAKDNNLVLSNYRVKASDRNLPRFDDKVVKVNRYCKQFEEGFMIGAAFLIRNKIEITDFISTSRATIQGIQSRILIRLTYTYSGVMNESYFPLYMSNYYEYGKLLELLWRGYDEIFVPEQIIVNEINQLKNNEVPYFFTHPMSTDLYDSVGKIVLKEYFETPGLDFTIKRISGLNEDIVAQQVNIIRRAFYIHNDYEANVAYAYPARQCSFTDGNHLSNEIGGFLYNLNRSDENEKYFSYTDFSLTKNDLWSQGVQNCDIFQGIEGVGIFFAALYATYGNKKYLAAANNIFTQSIELLTKNKNWLLDNPKNRIGLTNFPVSTFYFSILGNRILQNDQFSFSDETLTFFLKYLGSNYPSDDRYCYFFGSAGSLLVLMELFTIRKEPAIYDLIIKLGHHLVDRSLELPNGMITWEKPYFNKWGGFSHGNSSISYALFKLADLAKNERFYEAAIKALRYDQSLFDPAKQIWRKSVDHEGDIHHSWGNGSAGIGLSRHLISKYYTNDFLKEEIKISIKNIDGNLSNVMHSDHSICSGFLGMVELRKTLDPDFDYSQMIEDYIAGLNSLYEIKSGGWDKNPLLTGLYYGFAGVGYNLIKLTDNPALPSLLWL